MVVIRERERADLPLHSLARRSRSRSSVSSFQGSGFRSDLLLHGLELRCEALALATLLCQRLLLSPPHTHTLPAAQSTDSTQTEHTDEARRLSTNRLSTQDTQTEHTQRLSTQDSQ
eukprot:56956-Rhodomonas_salina.1